MILGDAEIYSELELLKFLTRTDFSALALKEPLGKRMLWKYAVGSRNDRYKSMILKPERGFIGTVVRSGRPVIIDQSMADLDRKRLENSIMLSEDLFTVAAAPVIINNETYGVVLAGSRRVYSFPDEDIAPILASANQFSTLLFIANSQ